MRHFTEDYAREVMFKARVENLEDKLAVRMARQSILEQPSPPMTWFIVEQAALRKPVGGAVVMAAQLEALLELIRRLRIEFQVIPESVGAHAAMGTGLTIFSFAEGPDEVYVENQLEGSFITSPEDVRRCVRIYDLARAVALSTDDSIDLIVSALKEVKS
ncbi:DUF5753 domain-containing protein [Kitasatospora sp. NPDC050543]|uniref:DUF5753 domain-containing protein n=1 Tax=Kitasatospora sp. NPDC050543 TaxID=3364054 RepID=UPI0037933D91